MKLSMKIVFNIFFLLVFSSVTVIAQAPGSSEIFSQVKSLWENSQITDLDQYLADLISQNPDYAPAITASSFHDAVFKGKLASAKQKLKRIENDATANPGKYNDEFVEAIEGLIEELDHEMAMHARNGTTESALEANASAIAVRNAWGDEMLPQIFVIEIADEVSL